MLGDASIIQDEHLIYSMLLKMTNKKNTSNLLIKKCESHTHTIKKYIDIIKRLIL